jgi:hypothetical protein
LRLRAAIRFTDPNAVNVSSKGIVRIRFVGVKIAVIRQVQKECAQARHIHDLTRRENQIDRAATRRHDQMDLEAVEVTAFTRTKATIVLASVEFAPPDAEIVADRHRTTIDNGVAFGIGLVMDLGQQIE